MQQYPEYYLYITVWQTYAKSRIIKQTDINFIPDKTHILITICLESLIQTYSNFVKQ